LADWAPALPRLAWTPLVWVLVPPRRHHTPSPGRALLPPQH
jgi:hypothetical protein